ncbi:WD repeat-containing protein 93-like isoform X2 [Littorina saxatilis]|uniref:WD repeat-containing protein 93 n=1 Tax=Littorina saxatilis TaxID=31220 RepID=A0AAN9C1N1_9CAEN
MPVYIRKNLSYTPPSIARMSDEDDDDYLQDPDQMRDILPQPYRMINKVLDKLLEDVWDILESKENKRPGEKRKPKPPKYDKPSKAPLLGQATALASSPDGKYLFAGLPNGLVALDALNQQSLSQWEEDSAEITSILTYAFSPTAYVLVTLDDMAVARLFLFTCDCLFFVKVMNDSEGGAKMLASRCEASLEGDYVGIVFENTSTKEVTFETHKVPREAWVGEIEAVEAKIQKEKEQQEKEQKEREEREKELNKTEENTEELPAPTEIADPCTEEPAKEQDETEKGDSSRAPTDPSASMIAEKIAHKFTPPTLVLRVRPPVPYVANPPSSAFSATQKVDATGAVLGMGQTHIMSAAHLESRDATFQHMHAGLVKYMTKDEDKKDEDVMTATFHFMNPGRTLLTGLEPVGQTDRPSCVALWWKGTNHLLQFSLLKVSKEPGNSKRRAMPVGEAPQEVEHKVDVVWPFSSKITCSAVSTCTSHIAVGLDNGNVTVWDRYMGLQRGVLNMNSKSTVQMLRFLDPALYPSSSMDYPPYPQRTATYMLAQYADSSQYLCDIGQATQDHPMSISDRPDKDDDVETLLESVPDIPELCLMVQKDGNLYLKDIQTGVEVCQLALPNTHQIMSPWEPVVAFGGRGQLLFVKGSGEEAGEAEESTDTSGVFVFTLRSYPTLDRYWNRLRTPTQLLVHPTIDTRLDALMKERLAQQALRKQRLQMRWGMLRSDLAVIQNAKEVVANTVTRQFLTPSSDRSLPEDVLGKFAPQSQTSLDKNP